MSQPSPLSGSGEASATLGLDRPTALFLAGFELGAHFALTGIRVIRPTAIEARLLRPSLVIDVEKPFGSSRVILRTIAAGVLSHDSIPAQHLVFLGGPTSGPGYEFHEFVAEAGMSQRLEWRFLAPFVPIPLGRYGRAPGTITLAPFATAVWIDRSAPFKAARQGWYPALGLGALTVFDVIRFDVARGLRGGRWTFSVDIGRDFWSVL